MRKWLWLSACLALGVAAVAYFAADFVHKHPDSYFARGVVFIYHSGTSYNPVVRFTHGVGQSVQSYFTKKEVPAAPVAESETIEINPETLALIRQEMEPMLQSELPKPELLGTIVLPEDFGFDEVTMVVPVAEELGGEEMAEYTPMEKLVGEPNVPLQMEYLHGKPSHERCLMECDGEDDCCEECEPREADVPAQEESEKPACDDPVCPNPCLPAHYHPHGGCTQMQACPYTGKCYTPPAYSVPEEKVQKSDEPKTSKGEEPAEPMSKPMETLKQESTEEPMKEEASSENGSEYDYHHYHHSYPRQIVCPHTGKCYPIEEEPCQPKETEPEIKAEEQQEVTPAQTPKSEKKPELKKKRKVRHKLYLLESIPGSDGQSDTLEFRPTDASPNEFGLIPF